MADYFDRGGLLSLLARAGGHLLRTSRSLTGLTQSIASGLDDLREVSSGVLRIDSWSTAALRPTALWPSEMLGRAAKRVRDGLAWIAALLKQAFVGPADHGAPLGGVLKRMLDISVALTATVILAPLLLVVMALIYLSMGRPIFFAHKRVGFNGRQFPCYKFRSMVNDADKQLEIYLANNPEAAEEWAERRKLAHDPRVTWIGRIVRKTSIDELPQLWNVFRGEMSCVGPRPIVTAEMERYGIHSADYLKARPGMTGLWQVSGRSQVDYDRRVALDTQYVGNWSIWLDLKVLLKTIPALLRSEQTS